MPKGMKKYYGPKTWTETLYHYEIDEWDVEWRKEQGDLKEIREGDSEFYLPSVPFDAEDDKNSVVQFGVLFSNDFDDTNQFITDTENLDWYKGHRI